MKSSIIISTLIFLAVIGWIASGQITKVNAQSENETKNSENPNEDIKNDDYSSNKAEIKTFTFTQIDQSIELQGQTIYNKKIDVKSETTGNIVKINFNRGNNVNKKIPIAIAILML